MALSPLWTTWFMSWPMICLFILPPLIVPLFSTFWTSYWDLLLKIPLFVADRWENRDESKCASGDQLHTERWVLRRSKEVGFPCWLFKGEETQHYRWLVWPRQKLWIAARDLWSLCASGSGSQDRDRCQQSEPAISASPRILPGTWR